MTVAPSGPEAFVNTASDVGCSHSPGRGGVSQCSQAPKCSDGCCGGKCRRSCHLAFGLGRKACCLPNLDRAKGGAAHDGEEVAGY